MNDDNKEIDIPDIGRIALGISKTNSNILYTLMSNNADNGIVTYFYMSENSGSTWNSIDLPDILIGKLHMAKILKRDRYTEAKDITI